MNTQDTEITNMSTWTYKKHETWPCIAWATHLKQYIDHSLIYQSMNMKVPKELET